MVKWISNSFFWGGGGVKQAQTVEYSGGQMTGVKGSGGQTWNQTLGRWTTLVLLEQHKRAMTQSNMGLWETKEETMRRRCTPSFMWSHVQGKWATGDGRAVVPVAFPSFPSVTHVWKVKLKLLQLTPANPLPIIYVFCHQVWRVLWVLFFVVRLCLTRSPWQFSSVWFILVKSVEANLPRVASESHQLWRDAV